jgi:hypothetical protein
MRVLNNEIAEELLEIGFEKNKYLWDNLGDFAIHPKSFLKLARLEL